MRAEMSRRCWADADAARAAGIPAMTLRQVFDGTRSVSGKLLAVLVDKWEIRKHPDLLRQWLLAFLAGQLNEAAAPLLRKAQLWPPAPPFDSRREPAQAPPSVASSIPFAPYAPLGDSRLATRRRLALLRLLYTRGAAGAVLPELCSAAHETGAAVRTELKYLERRGFVAAGEIRKTRISHPSSDQVEPVSRMARLQVWQIETQGAKIVEALKGLPDLEACDLQVEG
jgi:hypothetical protein